MYLLYKINYLAILIGFSLPLFGANIGFNPPDPYQNNAVVTDTIPLTDRDGDFISGQTYNPFDILPKNVEQDVEYDPETNRYIIHEKIGDDYYRAPSYMTFEEYLDWRAEQQETEYFERLAGFDSKYKSGSGRVDPMSKIDIDDTMLDRLFGGNDVSIKPQGTIDITLGADYQYNESAVARQPRTGPLPNFDMDIQMNVDGNIGEKMNIGFNYNTSSTFDFDRKIKLAYDSEAFSEDDIIKKIEAGNVNLPLRSNLIQGAESLFGLKTELQFGHLRLTALAAQQRSENDCLDIQNGQVEEEFEIRPDEYDENRHFFISHYHRNKYEESLSNLPYINNNFRITDIQVWVSEDRSDYITNSRLIAAISDIAEPNRKLFSNQHPAPGYDVNPILSSSFLDADGDTLPDNRVNDLFAQLTEGPNADSYNEMQNVRDVLAGQFRMNQTTDFEVYNARMLNSSEFTFNAELGFISLNVRLQPNQKLGVSYRYFYTGNCEEGEEVPIYKVGSPSQEFSESNIRPGDGPTEQDTATSATVLFVKMLKSSNQRVVDPSWDLMMKNVYALRTAQLSQDEFEFDIFFENDRGAQLNSTSSNSINGGALTKFLPFDGINKTEPLLNIFNLDRLNSVSDPQPDGVFDFVPGITVIPRNGSIIFPILEPFGDGLDQALEGVDQALIDSLKFTDLYDKTLFDAQEQLSKNKFVMKGRYKSEFSSEISLGAWNIPRGTPESPSVRVTAGGRRLREGIDFEIDYNIGRIRILNETFLQQGVPLQVCYENNSLFSLQQKTMVGLRADYEASDYVNLGATYLRLSEKPFTQKVNVGDDPIFNRIFGLDMDYSREAVWLTRALDKLPVYSTKEKSQINFQAEVAALKPGHAGAIESADEGKGVMSVDDFEGAINGIQMSSYGTQWILASTPPKLGNTVLPEAELATLANGANRAHLNWYILDFESRRQIDATNPYTRIVNQKELFQRDIPINILPELRTFDLHYDPTKRGPYNFDMPDGIPEINSAGVRAELINGQRELVLNEPETRWAGIMRYFDNTDFQAANYEFIDFWMLNPYMEAGGMTHEEDEAGFIYFHLGNVSEDILKDNLQFFENAIPVDGEEGVPVQSTVWGEIPLDIPVNDAFDFTNSIEQDKGLDGLNNDEERVKFQPYLTAVEPLLNGEIITDPSNDDYRYFNDDDSDPPFDSDSAIDRYEKFNNPENNAPLPANQRTTFERRLPFPDKEDLNNNKSLDQGESFYEYAVPIPKMMGVNEIDTMDHPFITDVREVFPDNTPAEKWYRFRIPISNPTDNFGEIEGFRSIQFLRMIASKFKTAKTFRFGEFELVRNQWRKLPICDIDTTNSQFVFNTDVVGIEENSSKEPFGYVEPIGILQERIFNSAGGTTLQDEKAMAIKFEKMENKCEASIYKLTELDLRLFKELEMFVHGEIDDSSKDDFGNGDLTVYLRLGKDLTENFYEYELPLVLSRKDVYDDCALSADRFNPCKSAELWRSENKIDFNLSLLSEMKKLFISEGRRTQVGIIEEPDPNDPTKVVLPYAIKNNGLDTIPYVNVIEGDTLFLPKGHRVRVEGNPSLGLIKTIQIGVRHKSEDTAGKLATGEVWVNELRVAGLEEKGGVAGLARLDVQLADLGNLSASASYQSVGWGALDESLFERSIDEIIEYDVAANIELGKFLPPKWNVRVPFYGQYAKAIKNPKYDAYTLDLTVEEALAVAKEEDRADVKARSQDVTTIKTINFINVRKERGSGLPASTSQAKASGNSGSSGKSGRSDKTQSRRVDNQGTSTVGGDDGDNGKKPKKERKPMPWDISNFSASYSYTETDHRDAIIERELTKDYNLGLDYAFSRKGGFIKPFDFLKFKPLKFIKEFNFNPLPNSFSFSSNINRLVATRKFRLPDTPQFFFDDRKFDWQRIYSVQWDLAKALKLTFNATNTSYIDELRQVGIKADPADRQWVNERNEVVHFSSGGGEQVAKEYWRGNISDWGRNKNYSHNFNLSYNVPFKVVKILDWVSVKAAYKAGYNWDAGPLITIDEAGNDPGAIISNSQNRSLNATFNFDKFYSKSKYFKNIERGKSSSKTKSRSSRSQGSSNDPDKSDVADAKADRKKEKKNDGPSQIERILIRPLLMLRNIKFTYKEDFGTTLPGFIGTPQYLGLSDGFSRPGVGFVTGVQPDISVSPTGAKDNWLYTMASRGWVSNSSAINQQVLQNNTKNYEANIDIEPFKNFKLDIDFKKTYRKDHAEEFRNKSNLNDPSDTPLPEDYEQLALIDRGSFEVTHFNLNTLFGRDVFELFDEFEDNRRVISSRLQDERSGSLPGTHIDNSNYAYGYGEQNSDVLVPAFLAAYSNIDPNQFDLSDDIEGRVKNNNYIPAPNWKLRYDGLSKMDLFKDIFSSFRIDHGYRNTLMVNSYTSDVEYNPQNQFQLNASNNYFSKINIPQVVINEQFAPLIGFDMKTKNELLFNFEYKKSRMLSLLLTSSRLEESLREEFTFGAGFTVKGVTWFQGNKKTKSRTRRSRDDDKNDDSDKDRRARGAVQNTRGSDLIFTLEMSISDDVQYSHQFDNSRDADPTRGTNAIRVSPALTYDLNENVGLRLFTDYSRTVPKITDSGTTKLITIDGGLVVTIKLK